MAARGTYLSFAAGSRHAFALRGGTSLVFRRSSWAQSATTPNTQGERVACFGVMCAHFCSGMAEPRTVGIEGNTRSTQNNSHCTSWTSFERHNSNARVCKCAGEGTSAWVQDGKGNAWHEAEATSSEADVRVCQIPLFHHSPST